MASVPKLPDLKLGDTPTVRVTFTRQIAGFTWTGILADIAMTADAAPVNNTTAVASRIGQALTVNSDGTATASMTLTPTEANLLVAGTTYHVEVQLRDSGNLVSTVYTATVKVVQDYVK